MGLFDALGGILGGAASGSAGGPFGAILGGVLGGLGGMSKEKQEKAMTKEQADLILRNAKEEALQKRQFDLEDRAYRQGGIAKFQQYYNPNFTSLSPGHGAMPMSAPTPANSGGVFGNSAPASAPVTAPAPGGFGGGSNVNPLVVSEPSRGRSGYLSASLSR